MNRIFALQGGQIVILVLTTCLECPCFYSKPPNWCHSVADFSIAKQTFTHLYQIRTPMISHCIFTVDHVGIIVIWEGKTQNKKCNGVDNHLVLELSSGDDSPSYLQLIDWQLAD